jgi:predicted RNA-binding protein with PUA-like domain
MKGRFWLMKSEPHVYSIDDLERDGSAPWTGIRNYEARNTMRDEMRKGDEVLFYHSSTTPPGVAGIARVCREAYPDFTAFDEEHTYHDPKSNPDAPRWYMVDVEFVEKFPTFVTLRELKGIPELADMVLLNRMRLSVQPVRPREFELVAELGRR